jgi:hypothetical protein
MSRKTMNVEVMLDWANTQLSRTDDFADKKFKSGICSMIEKILMDTGNYNGFYFIDDESTPIGYKNELYYNRGYYKK